MVTISTRLFGDLAVPAEKVFTFPAGLFGFPALRQFAVIELPQGAGLLQWLQPLEQPEIGFVLLDPALPFPAYQPQLAAADLAALGVDSADNLLVRVIAVVPANPRDMTVNLQAPVVFNPYRRRARQVILDDPRWPVRQPLPLWPAPSPPAAMTGG